MLDPVTLRHLDSPELSAEASALNGELRGWRMLMSTSSSVAVLTARISALAPIVMVAMWRWWVPLILVIVFLVVAVQSMKHLSWLLRELSGSGTLGQRRQTYFYQLATQPA